MARESAASLSVVPVSAIQRLAPPDDLDDQERAVWHDVVDSKPADWFGLDSAPLLTEYVRAAVMCGRLDLQVKAAIAGAGEPETAGLIKSYLDMRDKESKRLLSIGTKLRLTQQSRYTPKAASTANAKAGQARPWQNVGR